MENAHVVDKLYALMDEKKTPLCVGLDPNLAKFPQPLLQEVSEEFGLSKPYSKEMGYRAAAEAIRRFNFAIIRTTAEFVPVYKPQSAYYEQYGHWGIEALEDTIQFAQDQGALVILDAKRNDIGRTSQAYASAHLGEVLLPNGHHAISPDDADFMTVNGYFGIDGIKPFREVADFNGKGIFVLAKTSNKSSGELQDLFVEGGTRVYEEMARLINEWGYESFGESGYSTIGAVVGATYPKEAAKLREMLPYALFLMPGYGTQGAKAEMLVNGFDVNGRGATVNSSSGINYAFANDNFAKKHPELATPEKFAEAARQATIDAVVDINAALKDADKLPKQWAA